jgi:AraC-like DNA-binding protein
MPVPYIIGITISGLFVFFILLKKSLQRSDYLLIAINGLLCAFLLLDWRVKEGITVQLFFLQTIVPYLIFPVYFIFVLDSMQETIHTRGRWFLFFLPFVFSILFFIADLFFLNSYTTDSLLKLYNNPPLSYLFIYKGHQIYFIVILVWLLKRLRQYDHVIKDRFSFTDPIQLDWLRNTTLVYLVVQAISMLVFLISNLNLLAINIEAAYSIVGICVVGSIFYVSFHGIRQYSIAQYYGKQNPVPSSDREGTSGNPIETEPAPASVPREKYKSSSLSAEEQTQIYQKLLALFAEQSPYLEAKLQLQEVAAMLQVTTHNLSQTLNALADKPFYDFVNEYRVRHLQKLLADPAQKHFTILALGMESGFNSKASMNRVFKQVTGLSPKEYQLQNLADKQPRR